jgi:hypothetical protein
MLKTITFLVCLLAITQAALPSEERCLSFPQCYSKFGGLYYLHITGAKHSWYMFLTLRSDSSLTWISNEQNGGKRMEATELFFQPYSDLVGKWSCDSKEMGTIMTKDFGFMYSTVKSPMSMYINHNIMRLNMNNPKEITGSFQFRTYNMNSTYLMEAMKMERNDYTNMAHDQFGEFMDFSVKGYRLDRLC